MFIYIYGFIIFASILFFALLVYYGKNNLTRNDYDFSTSGSKLYIIFGCIFVLLSIFLECIVFFISIENEDYSSCFGFFVLGGIFYILSMIILLDQYFDYEAISGNEIIIHRFYRKAKHFPISCISFFDINNMRIFYKKDGAFAFTMDPSTVGRTEFLARLNRKKELLQSTKSEEEQNKYNSKLEIIGKEYRDSFKNRKTFFILSSLFLYIANVTIGIVLFVNINSKINLIIIFLFLILSALIGFVVICTSIVKMKDELSLSNIEIGEIHAKESQLVIGHAKNMIKEKLFISCLVFLLIISVGLLFILNTSLDKVVLEDELVTKTYNLEYVKRSDDYIALGFAESDTEYRVPSYSCKYFDDTFFSDANKNDEIIIKIDNSKDCIIGNKKLSKQYYNTLYYVSFNDKEYYTYNDYYLGHEYNVHILNVASYISFSCGGLLILIYSGFILYLNFSKKKEFIEL